MATVERLTRVAGLIGGMILALAAFATSAAPVHAATDGMLLAGTVRSQSGETLEGVTVSARAEGSTITTSVFTDEQGNYYFPPISAKGKYRIWAQATGFATERAEVELASAALRQDFALKTVKDVVKQLTPQEFVTSLPADTPEHRKMKDVFYNNCTGCHPPSYPLQNRFDANGWEAIISVMSKLVNGSGNYAGIDAAPFPVMTYYKKELAQYLAEARGPGASTMQIKLRPRPTGDPARAVITEYAVPVPDADHFVTDNGYATNDGSDWSLGTPSKLNGVTGLHDAQSDFNGNIWFTNPEPSYERSLGMIDAKTGKLTTVMIPGGEGGRAAATHGLAIDQKGVLWFTVSPMASAEGAVGSLGSIDPTTMKFEVYPPPKGMSGVTGSVDVDLKGNIWGSGVDGALRFNPATHRYTEYKSRTLTGHGSARSYGIAADREGNGWWTEINIDIVGKSGADPSESYEIRLPPRAALSEHDLTAEDRKVDALSGVELTDFSGWWSQGPRRMGADKHGDSVWVCDYWGGNMAKIDIHTLKPTFYEYPTPESAPYDAVVDKNHDVWVNLTNGDSFAKFDPNTEKWTEYPLPTRGLELRHISLDEHNGDTQVVLSYVRTGKVARVRFRTQQDLQALKAQVQELTARAH
jgi:streptogramin lyase